MQFLQAVLVMKLRLEAETAAAAAGPVSSADGDALGDDGDGVPAAALDEAAVRRAFAVLQSIDGVVSLQEVAAADRLFEAAAAVGVQLSYELLLQEVSRWRSPGFGSLCVSACVCLCVGDGDSQRCRQMCRHVEITAAFISRHA